MENNAVFPKAFCPLCGHNQNNEIFKLKAGNFDQSTLYPIINVRVCSTCGHVFNYLDDNDLRGLADYYRYEKESTNSNSQEKIGDLPSSNNPYTIERYQRLFDFLSPFLRPDMRILDIGFAKGGFIRFLIDAGYSLTTDIDIVVDYLGKKTGGLIDPDFHFDTTESSYDIIVMDQVLEHFSQPIVAFREARRLLRTGGRLVIGIPDAARYGKNHFFDYYWFLLREHIQHFDLCHLDRLALSEGFCRLEYLTNDSIMMNDTMVMPNLYVIYEYTVSSGFAHGNEMDLTALITSYLYEQSNHRQRHQALLQDLARKQLPLYIRGLGREFLYLYETAGLKDCLIKGLIDSNPFKQSSLTIDGKRVLSETALTTSENGDALLVTAIAHQEKIISESLKQNNKLSIVLLD